MIINPTKKALPIFNKIDKVKDSKMAKSFAISNPFFSWHANYYSVNHKKVVVLVNDLTFAAVVLYDINAKNKVNLDQYIVAGIRAAFLLAGVDDKNISKYFAVAEEIKINAGFNRQVTGVMTNLILKVNEGWIVNPRETIQTDIMDSFMMAVFKQKKYVTAKESVQIAFKKGISIVESNSELAEKHQYQINKTWSSYHQWDKYEDDESLFDETGDKFEKIMMDVQTNNELLLPEFKNYLTNSEGLSKKVVNKHVSNAEFFINQFLLFYTIKTPLKMMDTLSDYFSDWFPRKAAYSATEIKANAASMKKFVKFMEVAGEISPEDSEIAKEDIKDNTILGVEFLQNMDRMTGGWW